MVSYVVTDGTGLLGRRVVQDLLDSDPAAVVHVLVHPDSAAAFRRLAARWRGAERVLPLFGDPRAQRLGLRCPAPSVDHVVHLGAIRDLTAAQYVDGTRSALAFARETGAVLHHLSSVAVAGDHPGAYFEEDFDLGQNLTSPRQRTEFEAEKLVRMSLGVRWRIYRPALVVGDSRTGETDELHDLYHYFPAVAALANLPADLPIPLPDLGTTNIVPVDYVSAAVVALVRRPGLDRRTFHLVNPRPQPIAEIYRALAAAAGAPTGIGVLPGSGAALGALTRVPGVRDLRDRLLDRLGIPAAASVELPSRFVCDTTRAQLRGAGIRTPEFDDYAAALWRYWRTRLDAERAVAPDRFDDRVTRVTATSSRIDTATARTTTRPGASVSTLAHGEIPVGAVARAVDLPAPSMTRSITYRGHRIFGESSATQELSVRTMRAATSSGPGTASAALAPRPFPAIPGPIARRSRTVPG